MMGSPITNEQLKMWESYQDFLVKDRYAARDPHTGKAIESSYREVLNRITKFEENRDGWVLKDEHGEEHVLAKPVWKVFKKHLKKLTGKLKKRHIIPSTPVMMNLHSESKHPGLFACYPLGKVGDSLREIFLMNDLLMLIFKHAGGAGLSTSELRPKGSFVDNRQGTSSGPIAFMHIYGATANNISQGSRRRGALIISQSADHPDWYDFVCCKDETLLIPYPACMSHPLWSMNISLEVENFQEFKKSGKLRKTAEHAWKTGDPGLIYIENALNHAVIPPEYKPIYPNPCSEYLSVAYTSCNLHTVALLPIALQVYNKHGNFTSKEAVNEFLNEVKNTAFLATLFGNYILFLRGYPIELIRLKTTNVFRPVGIGFTGLHETLLLMGIKYSEGYEMTREIQRHLLAGTLDASAEIMLETDADSIGWQKPSPDFASSDVRLRSHIELAKYVDINYAREYDPDDNGTFVPGLSEEQREIYEILRSGNKQPFLAPANLERLVPAGVKDLVSENVIRCIEKFGTLFNSTTTTQMPTGTTSQFAYCASTGVEPIWEVEFIRRVRTKTGKFEEVTIRSLIADLVRPELIEPALEISVDAQLNIMRAVQEFCHTAVSKTVNLPKTASVEDIEYVFIEAYELGLKSIIPYRDGSKQIQVLDKKEKRDDNGLPDIREGRTWKIQGTRKFYITINFDKKRRPREIFLNIGKSGTEIQTLAEALGRLGSLYLKDNPDKGEKVVKTLQDIDAGGFYRLQEGVIARSIPDTLAKVLAAELGKQIKDSTEQGKGVIGDFCPSCGEPALVRAGNCKQCKKCGYSTC